MKRLERTSSSPNWPIAVGAPVWACDQWGGLIYPIRTPRREWLGWYSRAFNTVEGNSTFYALPSETTFQSWAEEAAEGFEFCFKFPRLISHELMLQHSEEPLREFVKRLEILRKASKLGPTFLQLGPGFGPQWYSVLARFLRQLSREFDWAVELRHHDWFDSNDNEKRVNELLQSLGVDKVLFDSRPLFQAPPDDEMEVVSQGKKPRTPVRQTVTANRPMLRIVGRNRIELAESFFRQWSPIVAGWIRAGLRPIVFTHAPDDAKAPALARMFLSLLSEYLSEQGSEIDLEYPELPPPQSQPSLFD